MSYYEGSNWQARKEDEGKPLYEQITGKKLGELLTKEEMEKIIIDQWAIDKDSNNEVFQVRSYLLDNYGPFSKSKILTGKEATVDMVKIVVLHFQIAIIH